MAEGHTPANQKPTVAFVLSLLAGMWMTLAAALVYSVGWQDRDMGGWMRGAGRAPWMWCTGAMRHMAGMFWWPWLGAVAGIIVLTAAAVLYARPDQSKALGIVILVLSALNVVVGSGGLLAGVLGIVGGALALTWRPQS